ncbi:MAG: malto-oligosyltrehalose trehalohydrolase [Chloroflexota bacterium]|nr:malto-oligosyltrehalose trehalohydrolase [Chloroflexota bacterium]
MPPLPAGEAAWRLEMGADVRSPAGVRFKVWAPAVTRVEVELTDSGEFVPLSSQGDGIWSSSFLAQVEAGSRYRYRLNGEFCRPDPYSRSQPEGVHGPSAVVDPDAFEWHDSDWLGLDTRGLVIYQCHVGTATPEGTFDGLIGELPRLERLGVRAIEPLPVAEFPGSRNWGYDGVDLFAPSHVYGGPDALKRFVDAAHQHGLGVIVDVVYNHLGPDGNYLRDFSPDYFTNHHQTPWGEAINYDRPGSEWVRKLVLDNARYWLHEYHADGLRLDATHAIFDDSNLHLLAELTRTVRASLHAERQVVLIAETSENDVRYLEPVSEGGFGLDAVWADDFHHSLRRYLAGDHEGYYADYSGTLDELATCINQGWLYEGQTTPRSGFKTPRGTPARERPASQFVYALQNHDQVGNRAFGDRLHHQIDQGRYRAASTLLLFLPYTPMLWMGQEFGASSPFQYFTDHHPDLGKLVTAGRRREFGAFSAFADPVTRERIPDPQAESTFLESKVHVEQAHTPAASALQALYQQLLELRRADAVLADQTRERMQARALTADVLAVRRWRQGQERLLLVNFGDTDFGTHEFGGGWQALLDSGSPTLADPSGVTVAARSAAVLAREVSA